MRIEHDKLKNIDFFYRNGEIRLRMLRKISNLVLIGHGIISGVSGTLYINGL